MVEGWRLWGSPPSSPYNVDGAPQLNIAIVVVFDEEGGGVLSRDSHDRQVSHHQHFFFFINRFSMALRSRMSRAVISTTRNGLCTRADSIKHAELPSSSS